MTDTEPVMSYDEMKAAIRTFCEAHGWRQVEPALLYGWQSPDGGKGYHWSAALEDSLWLAKHKEDKVTA